MRINGSVGGFIQIGAWQRIMIDYLTNHETCYDILSWGCLLWPNKGIANSLRLMFCSILWWPGIRMTRCSWSVLWCMGFLSFSFLDNHLIYWIIRIFLILWHHREQILQESRHFAWCKAFAFFYPHSKTPIKHHLTTSECFQKKS